MNYGRPLDTTLECRGITLSCGMARFPSIDICVALDRSLMNSGFGRGEIIVYECTSYPSNIETWHPIGFVVNSSQLIPNTLIYGLWDWFRCQVNRKKNPSELHIILGLLCWMNERYACIQQFPPYAALGLCVCVTCLSWLKGPRKKNKSLHLQGQGPIRDDQMHLEDVGFLMLCP